MILSFFNNTIETFFLKFVPVIIILNKLLLPLTEKFLDKQSESIFGTHNY